jgi:hypothetical protein
MGNIGLFVDGTKVASSTGPNSLGYVVFDLTANPLMVATGSHTIDVRADLIKGSARTIQLTLQNAGDLMVTDAQVGVNIAAISNGSSTVFSPVSGNTISINQGTLSIQLDPAFTAMTTIISGGVNQVIGKYTVVAYGEDQKITTITLTPTFTGSPTTAPATSSLNNVELYYNGSQVGSACQYVATACTFNLGSSLIAAAGTTGHLEVRADMQNAANANYTAGTITVATATVTSGGEQGLSSLQTNASAITIPTTSGLGIQLGTVSMAKTLLTQATQ